MPPREVDSKDFFATSGPTESQRYKLTEVIGKGSYGVVASAIDQFNNGSYIVPDGIGLRCGRVRCAASSRVWI